MELFAQYGLAGLVFGALFVMLKWMMKLHDNVMNQSAIEREKWQKVIEELSSQIRAHTASSQQFHEQMLEKGRQERKEHELIIKQIENCGFRSRHE